MAEVATPDLPLECLQRRDSARAARLVRRLDQARQGPGHRVGAARTRTRTRWRPIWRGPTSPSGPTNRRGRGRRRTPWIRRTTARRPSPSSRSRRGTSASNPAAPYCTARYPPTAPPSQKNRRAEIRRMSKNRGHVRPMGVEVAPRRGVMKTPSSPAHAKTAAAARRPFQGRRPLRPSSRWPARGTSSLPRSAPRRPSRPLNRAARARRRQAARHGRRVDDSTNFVVLVGVVLVGGRICSNRPSGRRAAAASSVSWWSLTSDDVTLERTSGSSPSPQSTASTRLCTNFRAQPRARRPHIWNRGRAARASL